MYIYLRTPLAIPQDCTHFSRESAFAHERVSSSVGSHVSILDGGTSVRFTRSVLVDTARSCPLHFNFSLPNKADIARVVLA